jgi:hypothetical protein
MTRHGLIGLVLVLLFATPVLAGTLAGIILPDSLDIDGQNMVLNGMALRKKVIFKVYVAGLYLPAKEKNSEMILAADQTRCTVMHFMRSVDAGKITEAWFDGLKANTPNHSPELKMQFDTLATLMEDLKNNDKLVFTYRPGKGTEVKVKGKVKGTLGDKALPTLFFPAGSARNPDQEKDLKKACWVFNQNPYSFVQP